MRLVRGVYKSVLHCVTEHNNVMWSEANADLMIKGLRSFNGLSPSEKGRFANLVVNLFNDFESYVVIHSSPLFPKQIQEWVEQASLEAEAATPYNGDVSNS